MSGHYRFGEVIVIFFIVVFFIEIVQYGLLLVCGVLFVVDVNEQ